MRVKDALAAAYQALSQSDTPTPQLDAQWLLCHLLGWERHHLMLRDDQPLETTVWADYQRLIERRQAGEPIAYLVGTKPFMGLDFKVGPGVLIPRPDTELLVEAVLSAVPGLKRFAEVGTGSGAVAISLLVGLPEATGVGLEISEKAIEITLENAYSNHVNERLNVRKSDCFSALLASERFDAIVSNPPYISKADMAVLMRDVADFEPHLALYGGEDGLDFYRRLSGEAMVYLNEGGGLFFEIGYDQSEAVMQLMAAAGFIEVRTLKDLVGHPRVVMGFKPCE